MEQGIPPWAQEIRERVVRIETKLDQYNGIREVAYKAREIAEDAMEGVQELRADRNRAIWAIVGAWLVALADLVWRRQGG